MSVQKNLSSPEVRSSQLKKKIVVIVSAISVIAAIALIGVELHERSKIKNCLSSHLQSILHSSRPSISFGLSPLIINYLGNNQSHLTLTADNVYNNEGLHLKADVQDTNMKTGVSQQINVYTTWKLSDLEHHVQKAIAKSPTIQSINQLLAFLNLSITSDVILEPGEKPNTFQLTLKSTDSQPALKFTAEPTIKNGDIHFTISDAIVNIGGFQLPQVLAGNIMNLGEDLLGGILQQQSSLAVRDDNNNGAAEEEAILPSKPVGFEYKSIRVDHDVLHTDLESHNYPANVDPNSPQKPINLTEVCKG